MNKSGFDRTKEFMKIHQVFEQWLPKSKEGKITLAFCLFSFIYFNLLYLIPIWWFVQRNDLYRSISGPAAFSINAIFTLLGLIYGIKAIFKIKDRAKFVIISFIICCLMTVFWILLGLGNLFSHY